jgi:hypothetical protein
VPFIVFDPADAAPAPVVSVGAPKTSEGDTLASMRAWLSRALAGRDDIESSTLNDWINDAYVDVCTSVDIDELKASIALVTIVDQPLYLLPYVVASTQGAALVDDQLVARGIPLAKVDKSVYRDWPDKTGRPEYYFREGDMLVIYPTPDKAYLLSLDVRIRPLRLVEDTDSPILGLEWHRPIRLNARQMAFDDLQEFDKALPAENSFVNSVRRRSNREANEDERRVVGSSVPGRGRRQYPYYGRD